MKVPPGRQVLSGLAISVIAIAIVTALVMLGSPTEQRMRRLDYRRVQNLRGITDAADLYWTRRGSLPLSLEDLSTEPGVNVMFRDPSTGQLYEYRALSDTTYELCADFQLNSVAVRSGFWSHGAGSQCFELVVREIRP